MPSQGNSVMCSLNSGTTQRSCVCRDNITKSIEINHEVHNQLKELTYQENVNDIISIKINYETP